MMMRGPRGPKGPAGAQGPAAPARRLAYYEATTPGDEILSGVETIIMTAAITPAVTGSLVAAMTLFQSGSDASAIVRMRISGGSYSNTVMFGTTVDAALSFPFSTSHRRDIVEGIEYNVAVTVEVSGVGFFQMFTGSSLLLTEMAPLS